MILQIENITKTYRGAGGEVRALKETSLSLEPSGFIAVQGPSGCGKSTLLLAAGAMLRPDSGTVLVDGQDPYALSADARARFRAVTIGFVFQQFHLIPYLNVLDNVLAPTLAVPLPDGKERALALLDHFGLWERAKHVPSELSTGERQRTALARALLHKPKLILADEPTGNLDPENAERVLDELRKFTESGGAILLVTHDDRVGNRADRIIRMT